jgi:regulator of CtrA degradation
MANLREPLTSAREAQPIPFVQRLTKSENFKTLFKEGMALVEESAAYLDKDGREDSRALSRATALAYAAESMRLTTRIMQLASWLLLQRAVNEGEMTMAQALSEKHRVRLSQQEIATAPEAFVALPPRLQGLCLKSLRLQQRILHLDASMAAARFNAFAAGAPVGLSRQVEQLQAAFAR